VKAMAVVKFVRGDRIMKYPKRTSGQQSASSCGKTL